MISLITASAHLESTQLLLEHHPACVQVGQRGGDASQHEPVEKLAQDHGGDGVEHLLNVGGRQVSIARRCHGSNGPVETADIVVGIGGDVEQHAGPGGGAALAGLAAKHVPEAGDQLGAEGDEHNEFEQPNKHRPGRRGEEERGEGGGGGGRETTISCLCATAMRVQCTTL